MERTNKIDEYFKNKTKEITFIELKDNSILKIKDQCIKDNLPLPILTDTLIDEIKSGDIEQEIKVSHIIEGIIKLIGIDYTFKHVDEYKEILNLYDDIKKYIFYKGMKCLEENEFDNAAIYFRCLNEIDKYNVSSIFNYALSLEGIAKRFLSMNNIKEGREFLIKSTNEIESILDIRDDFSLAYYKLGFHYKYYEQFLKAKLIWNKFLKLDKDEVRVQEIRDELELIDDDAKFESGLTYLTYGEYEKSLDVFLKLAPKYKDWWKISYLIGLSYKGLGEYNTAIDYFYESIELSKEEIDVYNELGICLFTIGDIEAAIEVFSEGIEVNKEDYKILFNRGLSYIQLGNLKKALYDVEKAYILNPNDKNISNQLSKLKESFVEY